jgi:hypothetical protein
VASSRPVFRFYVDWLNDGDFIDTNDEVTSIAGGNALAADGMTITYGRDQARAFSPVRAGEAAFKLNNAARIYSPENASSPLFGQLVPGRPVKITATQDAATTTIYRGFLDDFTVSPNRGGRTVTMSCLDAVARFAQANPISTPLYASVRTGTAIGLILDALGWPGGARDLDPGASTIRWWWEEGTDGLTALNRMLAAEGPPAICFVDTNANFVFRDRHHRLLDAPSTAVQATFTNGTSTETATTVTYSQPMTYDTGWRDICNTIITPVDQRNQQALGVVWQTDATVAVPAGTSVTVIAQSSDPFLNAVTPVAGTDYTLLTGTATATLSRTSGQSTAITFTDTGAGSLVTGLQLQACPVTVARTVQVSVTDTASQTAYGVRGLPSGIDISGATVEDVVAVATIYVTRYAQRQPIVSIPVANANDKRLTQQLARDLSDRVHITDTELGLNADFFIDQISHATSGTGRVLTTTFGCEKADATTPANVFTFDDATNGKFNTGKFGT